MHLKVVFYYRLLKGIDFNRNKNSPPQNLWEKSFGCEALAIGLYSTLRELKQTYRVLFYPSETSS